MRILHTKHAFFALLLAAAVAGCSKKGEATSEASVNAEGAAVAEAAVGVGAFVEEHDGGSVAWNVGSDGNVKAAVSGTDGKPIRENVTGTMTFKADGEPKTVPLTADAKTGV